MEKELKFTEDEYKLALADLMNKHDSLSKDFSRYKERTVGEMSKMRSEGAKMAVEAFLPILDDLERATDVVEEDVSIQDVIKGNIIIHNKARKILKDLGVSAIKTIGVPFNVNFHEACMTVPTNDKELDGTISHCLEIGYSMGNEVIRHAKVAVYAYNKE